jgi:hypothetical protein
MHINIYTRKCTYIHTYIHEERMEEGNYLQENPLGHTWHCACWTRSKKMYIHTYIHTYTHTHEGKMEEGNYLQANP